MPAIQPTGEEALMESEHLNGSASGVALAEQEALTSPFTESASTEGEAVPEAPSEAWLASPFAEAGIQRLVDEAAAMHLRSAASWSSESEAVDRADRELESWFESLAGEADRLLEHLEAEFGSRTPESLAEGELEAAGEAYFAEHATEHPATEQFLGGLIKKAVKLAKGVSNITILELESLSEIFGQHISHDRHTLPHARPAELVASLHAPALLCTGWYDWGLNDALATWDLLMQAAAEPVRTRSRLLITPSSHNMPGYHEGMDDRPELYHAFRVPTNGELLLRWHDAVRTDTTSRTRSA